MMWMNALHVDYLCKRLKIQLPYSCLQDDSEVLLLVEMISKIDFEVLVKNDEFISALCKKIHQYQLISEFSANGIPYYYDYVNS